MLARMPTRIVFAHEVAEIVDDSLEHVQVQLAQGGWITLASRGKGGQVVVNANRALFAHSYGRDVSSMRVEQL